MTTVNAGDFLNTPSHSTLHTSTAYKNEANTFSADQTVTGGIITSVGVAIGAYSSVPAGRMLAISAPTQNFGIEVVHSLANSDGIASYNKGEGAAAFYAEITPDSNATVAATGYRLEMRKAVTTPIGYHASDYIGTADPGFKYESALAGGNGFFAVNTHQATPNAPFSGGLILDNQQSGATGNVGFEVRQYQDNLDGFLLRDAQRSNAKSVEVLKDASGGRVRVNKSDGTERATLRAGSSGNRGVVKLWDATLAAFRWAHIDNGAWVISSTEPT